MQHTCAPDPLVRNGPLAGVLMALSAAVAAVPAAAQEDVTETDPDIVDVALTPLSDLNLARDPIPPILVWALENPYTNDGLEDCSAIRAHIADLDAVLGDDIDTEAPDERRLTATSVAQRAIGMFIPFRGIIREISGANEHEHDFRQAIAAGLMRRSYLKGLGEARGCPYPARPMPDAMLAALKEGEPLVAPPPQPVVAEVDFEIRFVPSPVVQSTD